MHCRKISALLALLAVTMLLGGCATGGLLGEREIAGMAQVSSPKLMSLCTAYAKLKRYNKLFRASLSTLAERLFAKRYVAFPGYGSHRPVLHSPTPKVFQTAIVQRRRR